MIQLHILEAANTNLRIAGGVEQGARSVHGCFDVGVMRMAGSKCVSIQTHTHTHPRDMMLLY